MSTTTDPYPAWSDRWQAQGGDTLPALGYVPAPTGGPQGPGPVRELQEPEPISEEEARTRLPPELPMTAGEWGWVVSFAAVWICLCALLTWLHSGISPAGLLDSMRECLGR